jgi:hypothetical protein
VKKKVVLPDISYSCEEDEDEDESYSGEEEEEELSSEEEEEDESSSEEEGEEESSSEEEGEEESSSPGEEGIKGKAYLGKDDNDESSSGEEEEEEHVVRTILHFSSTKFIRLTSCHCSSPRPHVHVRYIGSIPGEVQDCKICDTQGKIQIVSDEACQSRI